MEDHLGVDNPAIAGEPGLGAEGTPSQVDPVRMSTGEYRVERGKSGLLHVRPIRDALDCDEDAPHPLAEARYEDFVLERPVGSGGIAELWLGRHADHHEPAVVKVARQEFTHNEHVHAQFDREWAATRVLRHPAVLRHWGRGRLPDGRPFVTMELVQGYPLTRFVARPVRWKFIKAAMLQLCDALSYVHGNGILHQDLKPSNILIDQNRRRLRITDFGLARLEAAQPGATTRSVLGTPCYMAPEQARGQLDLLGPHTDLYTVGVMLFELLAGTKPFHDESDRVVMIKHCTCAPPDCELRPGIDAPPGVLAILERLLAKSHTARYASAAALRRAIAAL